MYKPLDMQPLHTLLTEDIAPSDLATMLEDTIEEYVQLLLSCGDLCLPLPDHAKRLYHLQELRKRLLELDVEE